MIQSVKFDSPNMDIKKLANSSLTFTVKRLLEIVGIAVSFMGICGTFNFKYVLFLQSWVLSSNATKRTIKIYLKLFKCLVLMLLAAFSRVT